ncbi:hypothetical protein BDR07DRAFT_1553620, partial [Suillus spraguei]
FIHNAQICPRSLNSAIDGADNAIYLVVKSIGGRTDSWFSEFLAIYSSSASAPCSTLATPASVLQLRSLTPPPTNMK